MSQSKTVDGRRSVDLSASDQAATLGVDQKIEHLGSALMRERLAALILRRKQRRLIRRAKSAPQLPYLGEFSRVWLQAHAQDIACLPVGTAVAVRIPDGAYVTAPDSLAAMDAFEARFGTEARGWVHEVGIPIKLGGGQWQQSSGA